MSNLLCSTFRNLTVEGCLLRPLLGLGVNSVNTLGLGDSSSGSCQARQFSNCHRASITRTNRLQYLYNYPTVVVNPDGSTFTIRHPTPRKIIKLPVDITQLSDSARNKRLERRKPKTKVKLDEEFEEDDSFDAKKYLKYVKK